VALKLLGEVAISVDGEAGVQRIAGQRQRAVAAVLALAAPAMVPTDRLIDVLWPEDPPQRARNSIQRFVSDLRRHLGEHTGLLVGSRDGYQLHLDRHQIDARCAEDLLAVALVAESDGDIDTALEHVSRARALWSGPALSGTGPVRTTSGLVVPLDELLLRVVECQARALLALGRADGAIAGLRDLAPVHPGRDELWAVLALAEAAAGQQRKAAATLRQLRADHRATGIGASSRVSEAEAIVFAVADPGDLAADNAVEPSRLRRSTDHEVADSAPAPRRLPAALESANGALLVGRDRDLERLTNLLAQPSARPHHNGDDPTGADSNGAGATLSGASATFITGEAGIGKTHLAAAFAVAAHEAGWLVAFGRSSAELDASFEAWSDALATIAAQASDGDLVAHRAVHGAALAGLVPGLAARWGIEVVDNADVAADSDTEIDNESSQLRTFAAVVDLLDRCCGRAPTLIVLDDQHWATPTSTALLRYVLDRVVARLVIVVTYRDTDIAADHPLWALSVSTPSGRPHPDIRLGALDAGDIETLMAQRQSTGAASTLRPAQVTAEALRSRTGGNPLFVTEMLRHIESGTDTATDVAAAALEDVGSGDFVPESIQRIVEHRVARLDESTIRFLYAAAVWGRSFDLDHVAKMIDVSPIAALDTADDGEAAGIIGPLGAAGATYEFTHDLVRSALESSMSGPRRARYHLIAADVIASNAEPDVVPSTGNAAGMAIAQRTNRLARHLVAAGELARPERTIAACATAAQEAAARYAPDEAVTWYEQAVGQHSRLDDAVGRARILVELAVQQRHLGGTAHRELLDEAAAVAHRTGAAELVVEVACADVGPTAASLYFPSPERLARLEAGLAACSPDDSVDRARLLAAVATQLHGPEHRPRRLALRAEAAEVARRVGDPHTLADALLRIARSNPDPLPLVEADALNDEVSALLAAAEARDPELEFSLIRSQLAVAYTTADGRRADELVEQSIESSVRFPTAVNRLSSLYCQTVQASVHGDTERFARLNDEAFVLGTEHGLEEAAGVYQAHLGYLYGLQGRTFAIASGIADWAAQHPDQSAYLAGTANILSESGRLDEALAIFVRFASGELMPEDNAQRVHLTALWGLTAWKIGEPDVCARVRDALEPHRHLVASYVNHVMEPIALTMMNLATRLGRFDEALADYELAREIAERLDAQWMMLAADQSLAEMLIRRAEPGDVDRARVIAAEILDASISEGFGGLYQRATFALQTELFGTDTPLPVEAFVQITPLAATA